MIGFINQTAPKFTSVEISKKFTFQKRENFILYSSEQPQSDLARIILKCVINMRKKAGDLFQKLESLIRFRFEIRFIDFLQMFLNIAIFNNTRQVSPNDLAYERHLSGITLRLCVYEVLLRLLKTWDRLRFNLWLTLLILFFFV